MIKGVQVVFKNKPTAVGFETITVDDCLVAPNGSPNGGRPQILIHLPKADQRDVDDSFVIWGGKEYHVIGTTAARLDDNTPTRWDRYAIAEHIIAL